MIVLQCKLEIQIDEHFTHSLTLNGVQIVEFASDELSDVGFTIDSIGISIQEALGVPYTKIPTVEYSNSSDVEMSDWIKLTGAERDVLNDAL